MNFFLRIFKMLFGRSVFGKKVEDLIEKLSSATDPREKKVAGDTLAQMGASAVGPLIDLLTNSPSKEQQQLAADVLVKIGGPAVEPLRSLLDGLDDNDLRQLVTRILERIQNKRYTG